jgi:hypothetical protein
MSTNQESEVKRRSSFNGFLMGVGIGALFGLLTHEAWGFHGPYRAQIGVGFWGLVGGILGLLIGAVRHLKRRNRKNKDDTGHFQ